MDRRCGVSLPGSALRDGYKTCCGTCTRDVAASCWPAVEAATKFPLDVAASLVPAVAAAEIMSFPDVAASLESAVEAAALYSHIRSTIRCRTIATCGLWSSGKLGSRLQFWRTLVFFDFFMPSQLGEQVATCTFLHELLEARNGAGSSIGALSCSMSCLMRVSTYPRLRTRSGKNFECLVSNTAFNEYVALFFASDSVWPRVC